MKEVVHILGLLKQQAEAALAMKTNRKKHALNRIAMLTDAMFGAGKAESAHENALVYEQWCVLQRQNIDQIKTALPILEQDIRNAFQHLETVQAKVTAADDLAAKERHRETLKQESVAEDAMLELSLLRRVRAK